MTLIAYLAPIGIPILVGDTLISGYMAPQEIVLLPTVRPEVLKNLEMESSVSITDRRQKISLINPHFAFAWSGAKMIATSLLKALKATYQNNIRITPAEVENFIKSFLNEYEESEANSVGILCLLTSPDNDEHDVLKFNISNEEETRFGRIICDGSGSNHFLKIAGPPPQSLRSPDHPPIVYTLLNVLHITATALAEEMFNKQATLRIGYGAGFEVIAPHPSGNNIREISKFSDFCYLFWIGDVNEANNVNIRLVLACMKPFYVDDTLYIARITFPRMRAMQGIREEASSLYSFLPIDQSDIPSTAPDLPNIKSSMYVNHVTVRSSNGQQRHMTCILPHAHDIVIEGSGDDTILHFPDRIMQDFCEKIINTAEQMRK